VREKMKKEKDLGNESSAMADDTAKTNVIKVEIEVDQELSFTDEEDIDDDSDEGNNKRSLENR